MRRAAYRPLTAGKHAREAGMEFRILGPLEVIEGDLPVLVAGAEAAGLLALLLLHANEVVSSDRLVDELWPREDRSRVRRHSRRASRGCARRSGRRLELLATVRSRLRRPRRSRPAGSASLREPSSPGPPTRILRRPQMLLREALALWRGPALADSPTSGSRRRRSAGWTNCTSWRSRNESTPTSRSGGMRRARARARGTRRGAPAARGPARQLMLALYRAGRQAEALERYRAARQALVEELGHRARPALQELEQAILRQDPSLDLAAAGPSTALDPRRRRSTLWRSSRCSQSQSRWRRKPEREIIVARVLGRPRRARRGFRRAERPLRRRSPSAASTARAAAFTSASRRAQTCRGSRPSRTSTSILVSAPPALLEDLDLAELLAHSSLRCRRASSASPGAGACSRAVRRRRARLERDRARGLARRELGAAARARRGPAVEGGRDASRLLASASLAGSARPRRRGRAAARRGRPCTALRPPPRMTPPSQSWASPTAGARTVSGRPAARSSASGQPDAARSQGPPAGRPRAGGEPDALHVVDSRRADQRAHGRRRAASRRPACRGARHGHVAQERGSRRTSCSTLSRERPDRASVCSGLGTDPIEVGRARRPGGSRSKGKRPFGASSATLAKGSAETTLVAGEIAVDSCERLERRLHGVAIVDREYSRPEASQLRECRGEFVDVAPPCPVLRGSRDPHGG